MTHSSHLGAALGGCPLPLPPRPHTVDGQTHPPGLNASGAPTARPLSATGWLWVGMCPRVSQSEPPGLVQGWAWALSHSDWLRAGLVAQVGPNRANPRASGAAPGKSVLLLNLGLSGAGLGLSVPPQTQRLPVNEAGTEKMEIVIITTTTAANTNGPELSTDVNSF